MPENISSLRREIPGITQAATQIPQTSMNTCDTCKEVWMSWSFLATLKIAKLGFMWSFLFLRALVLKLTLALTAVSELVLLWGSGCCEFLCMLGGRSSFLLSPNDMEMLYWSHSNYTVTMRHGSRSGCINLYFFLVVMFAFSSRCIWMGYFPDEAWWASIVGWSISSCNQCSHQHRIYHPDRCFPHRIRITEQRYL